MSYPSEEFAAPERASLVDANFTSLAATLDGAVDTEVDMDVDLGGLDDVASDDFADSAATGDGEIGDAGDASGDGGGQN